MNKKLSQLTEKTTSLDANDLMLVSTGGESKSVKVSTLEAPLKSYTDSAVSAESSSRQSAISQEISDRLAGDASTLADAQSYTNSAISVEQTARDSADQAILALANAYTDSSLSAIQIDQTALNNLEASLQAEITSNISAYAANSFIDMQNYVADQINTLPSYTTQINSLQSQITAEISRAATTENNLSGVISQLTATVSDNYHDLDSRLDASSLTESSIQSALNAEITRALAAEASLSSQISSVSGGAGASFPVGSMMVYAGATAPTGWLLCDGSAVSRTTYSGLFTVIGSSFGAGNGSTTFNVPNPDVNANLKYIIKT